MKLRTLFRSDSGVSDMSTGSRSKKSRPQIPFETHYGQVHEELEAPITSEVVFRKIWTLKDFHKEVLRRDFIDSPNFRCSVNGVKTHWNISIRFWREADGKKIINPIVLCLNYTGCETEAAGQARVRFQFGTWNDSIKHWECSSIANVIVNLQNKHELHSVGHETLKVFDHQLTKNKNLKIMAKIQVIRIDEEKRSLSQDLTRVFKLDSEKYADTIVYCVDDDQKRSLKAHSLLIKARSPILTKKLYRSNSDINNDIVYELDLQEYHYDIIYELFRFIYSDKVDNADIQAARLLPLSIRFDLPGLTALCERALAENLTPSTVANTLLIADQFECENLRKISLQYCEQSETIRKSIEDEDATWTIDCHHCRFSDKILEQYADTDEPIQMKPRVSVERRDSLRYQRQTG